MDPPAQVRRWAALVQRNSECDGRHSSEERESARPYFLASDFSFFFSFFSLVVSFGLLSLPCLTCPLAICPFLALCAPCRVLGVKHGDLDGHHSVEPLPGTQRSEGVLAADR